MKVSWKQSTDGTQYQLAVEAQNNDEDIVIQALYHQGAIQALGQARNQHYQLILSTRVPDWYREQRRGLESDLGSQRRQ